MRITATTDAKGVLDKCYPYLSKEPIRNNLVMSLLLGARTSHTGRFWITHNFGHVAGLALQTSPEKHLQLSTMEQYTASEMARVIGLGPGDLPGVSGERENAEAFARAWAQQRGIVFKSSGELQVLEARAVTPSTAIVKGHVRQATLDDLTIVSEWVEEFTHETKNDSGEPRAFAHRRIMAGEVLLWCDPAERSMACLTAPIARTSRVQYVFTPLSLRGRGFAEALVRQVTLKLLHNEIQPLLFVSPDNLTAVNIYKRIGYQNLTSITDYVFTSTRVVDL